MKKGNLIFMFLILGILMSGFVAADMGDTLKGAWNGILEIGNLSFIFGKAVDNQFVGFVRILLTILIFTVLYWIMSISEMVPKNIRIVIAAVVAIITAIFMPASLLMAFGGTYAVLFSLLFLGAPVVGLLWLLFKWETESRFVSGVKVAICCVLIWIVSLVSTSAKKLSGGAVELVTEFSGFIGEFADYATMFIVLVLIYFIWKTIRPTEIPDKLKEPVKGLIGRGGIVGDWAATKDRFKKIWRGEKKAERATLSAFVNLKGLKKIVNEAKSDADLDKLNSKEKKAIRHERRAFARTNRLKTAVKTSKLSKDKLAKAENIIKKMDVLNKEVVVAIRNFNNVFNKQMPFAQKKKLMGQFLDLAINSDEGVVASFRNLRRLLEK